MSLQFTELHLAIRICRTCSERRGSRRRQPLMELQYGEKLNKKENVKNAESERKKKEKR